MLDPALLRPGRFDRQVVVPNPDIVGREQILKVHMRKVQMAPDVDPRVIARGTPGFSGADLANLVNEAALLAARAGKRLVTMFDFEAAKDKVLMGVERRSMVMTDDEKRLTAYHEAGHALVGLAVPRHDPLHKVTIIPARPRAGRHHVAAGARPAQLLEASSWNRGWRCCSAAGSPRRSSSASTTSPPAPATTSGRRPAMARRMVTEFGFSDKLGPLRYCDNQEEIFLGHSVTQQKNVADATARVIDEEVRRLIDEAEAQAREILLARRDDLERLANALLEYETLSRRGGAGAAARRADHPAGARRGPARQRAQVVGAVRRQAGQGAAGAWRTGGRTAGRRLSRSARDGRRRRRRRR